jgi:hypothetical protein
MAFLNSASAESHDRVLRVGNATVVRSVPATNFMKEFEMSVKHQKLVRHRRLKYYDLKKNWRRVRAHLADKELNNVLVTDFNKFTVGSWDKKFTRGRLPREFETVDWELNQRKRGRPPAFCTIQSTEHVIG